MQPFGFDFVVKDTPEVQPRVRRSRGGGMKFDFDVLRPCALISAKYACLTQYFNGVSPRLLGEALRLVQIRIKSLEHTQRSAELKSHHSRRFGQADRPY